MAVRQYYGLQGSLVATVNNVSGAILVSSSLSGAIAASGFVNGVDETYLSIATANFYELVMVTAVNGNALTVQRGQGGTTAQAFPIGSAIKYEVTSEAIITQIGVVTNIVTMTGTGIAQVVNPATNVFEINTDMPRFVGKNGIDILGVYPDYTFIYTSDEGGCCGNGGSAGGSGGGLANVIGEGLVTAFINGDTATVRVVSPTFTPGPNISITGAWPNYTIGATAGSGTVSSVSAGAGLTLTGSPSVNPTISMSSSGVVAGTYGGVAINARGQITTVPVGFNPISTVVGGAGLTAVRLGDTVTLTPVVAAIGVRGIVALADPADPFDPLDALKAATPAVVAKGLLTVGSTVAGVNSFTSEVAALYTNTIAPSNTALVLLAGKSALVIAEVTMVDGTDASVAVNFGMAVFDGSAAIVKGNRKVTQNIQQITFVITGAINTSLTIVTTAVPAGASVQSYSLSVAKF